MQQFPNECLLFLMLQFLLWVLVMLVLLVLLVRAPHKSACVP